MKWTATVRMWEEDQAQIPTEIVAEIELSQSHDPGMGVRHSHGKGRKISCRECDLQLVSDWSLVQKRPYLCTRDPECCYSQVGPARG